MGVGVRVDVRVDAYGDRGVQAQLGGDAGQQIELGGRLDVKGAHSSSEAFFQLAPRLAHPGEDDLLRREAHAQGQIKLAARNDIGACTQTSKHRAERWVSVRLERVADQEVRGYACESAVESCVPALDHPGAVDVKRRAEASGQFR